jgi:hypothetical protein
MLAILAGVALSAGWAVAQPGGDKPATKGTQRPADKASEKAQPEKGGDKGKSDSKGEAKSEAKEFSVEGYYVEACSCKPPCPCELTGANMSCEGVGAYDFEKGKYAGEDFSGTRVAYSLHIGKEVHLYIDAPDAKKRAAAEKFARAALAAFGPVKGVHEAKIEITGKDGNYTFKVDGGKVLSCTTSPVLGGDHKNPIKHENTLDAVNPVMYQGLCESCTYVQGDNKITLEKGRNAYFNQHMKTNGKV